MPFRLPANRMLRSFALLRTVPIGLSILLVPALALADDDCSIIASVVHTLLFEQKELPDPRQSDVAEVLRRAEAVKGQELSCEQLQQRQANRRRTGLGITPWSPFEDDQSVTDRVLFERCNARLACKQSVTIVNLLKEVCSAIGQPAEVCAAIKQTSAATARPELSKLRKGFGWGLIISGGAAVILGTVQLFVPLGSQDTGCASHGLDLPCAPDRFGLGFGLLSGGVVAGVGGILTLKL